MAMLSSLSRRDLLARAGNGFGLLALAGLLQDQKLLGAASPINPLAPRVANRPARAKSVIWLFINGGPSHVDTWDHKPELTRKDGQTYEGFDKFTGFFSDAVGPLMGSPFNFRPRGQCGKHISDLFPRLGEHVDKMAFVHSCHTDSNNHSPALFKINTGEAKMGHPCVGSWVTYGLGSDSSDLPAFVVMSDPKGRGLPKGHASNWGSGFLPSVYQGTHFRPAGDPIDNLRLVQGMNRDRQRSQLDLLASLNHRHLEQRDDAPDLAARIESFELAFRMQAAAPEALDVAAEPESVHRLYGLNDDRCAHFGRQCLIARRMVERGVRFVQIYSGGMENQRSWDGHNDIAGNHGGFAAETDTPIAGLLSDLEQRGLLDETLVIWGGEFGRLPVSQKAAKPGRDHNPHAFTTWFAGGGAKGGVSYGQTDELGHRAVVDRVAVRDLHATILHLLGMDHETLTYRHHGLDYRLTTVEEARVIREILA